MYTGKQHQSYIYISMFYPPSSAVTPNVPKHLLIQKLTTKCSVTSQLTFKAKIKAADQSATEEEH